MEKKEFNKMLYVKPGMEIRYAWDEDVITTSPIETPDDNLNTRWTN